MDRASWIAIALTLVALSTGTCIAEDSPGKNLLTKPGLFTPLIEPPCSYASTQNRKNLIAPEDRVLAWIRSEHNGGAIPVRHFLAVPRVINDTYGLFFYDPDGGYIAAYKKDYGYKFHGWRGGVMVAEGPDGSLWSALTGVAFEGPRKGSRLERIPNFVTDWGYWLMLHPESTAYDLFDGKKYPAADPPSEISQEALLSMGVIDARLDPMAMVMGVEVGGETMTFPLGKLPERACLSATIGGEPVTVFWYAPTASAVAFASTLDERKLTFYADSISPETAPIKDKETQTRWSLAGRGIDGPLRGKELRWVNSIQCRWYAWSAEYPETGIFETGPRAPSTGAN